VKGFGRNQSWPCQGIIRYYLGVTEEFHGNLRISDVPAKI
jgi:hypothetical protein